MTAPGSYEVALVSETFNYRGIKTLYVRPGEVIYRFPQSEQ